MAKRGELCVKVHLGDTDGEQPHVALQKLLHPEVLHAELQTVLLALSGISRTTNGKATRPKNKQNRKNTRIDRCSKELTNNALHCNTHISTSAEWLQVSVIAECFKHQRLTHSFMSGGDLGATALNFC